jgi:sugar lactone lactonase YvrE
MHHRMSVFGCCACLSFGCSATTGPGATDDTGATGDGGPTTTDAGVGSDGSAGANRDGAGDAPYPTMVTYAAGVTVSTLAGGSHYGDVDGPNASFANPTGIALYGSDGVIVVENDTGAIRTVSATGVTTTVGVSPVDKAQTSPYAIVAGAQGQGYYYSTDFDESGTHVEGGGSVYSFVPGGDGGGASALVVSGLYVPRTLVPLPGGDLFVFDTAITGWPSVTEEVAERVTPTGTLTLIAGHRGDTGFANGQGAAAVFGSTTGGVLLPDGSAVVVADCGNNRLRRVGLDGTVTTYAGSTAAGWVDGPLASALFSCPRGLAIDAAGNIFVRDANNNAIRRLGIDGEVMTLAGDGVQGFADGPGKAAEFYGAEGLVVSTDGSTLFVADGTEGNGALPYNRIRKVALPPLDGGVAPF